MKVNQLTRKHYNFILNWCVETFGISQFNKNIPKLTITKKKSEWCGEYDPDKNKITIWVINHSYIINVIDTVIHEYIHYKQNNKMYDVYFDTYNKQYHNHPYEISAINKASKYSKKCKKDLLKHFKKIS